MPRNTLGAPPFPPVITFDADRKFTLHDLRDLLGKRPNGVSVCIRHSEGPRCRGGYFFHFAPKMKSPDEIELYDFEKILVWTFRPQGLVAFINHCTGRQFDEQSFVLSQTQLNFLSDE